MLTNISTSFYDVMFGDINSNIPMGKLETKILQKVRVILNNPKRLSQHIPALPAMLVRLLNAIDDPDSSVLSFVEIIEQDPGFAIAVLKTANSALYHRGEKEIVSLGRAITFLGLSGLLRIATTLLMAKIIPCKPIYYRMFGKQIWVHSVQCATLCELLATKDDENGFDAYFLGLIHDLGKIIIFDCLSEALAEELSSLPGTKVFKELMTEMSIDISYFIAIEWKLPNIYSEALRLQQTETRSSLAELLFKANQLSEVYLMMIKGMISEEECENILTENAVDKNIWLEFTHIAPEIESSII
ncbi:HDOD domain-containing protein [Colwellia sp. BRX10-3]|uniref:HDOD domain-containing protein n=1 Tax=Colwellia sp. BRX10-3 TaxID=2759844 RepID=UPI0015F5AE2B|nr:HDOD domain-containing protein [Colwellia sp. BRX10-3]MBA6392194.1 HDOD domain-containing protein [Colwellia sp. BRX10-3]